MLTISPYNYMSRKLATHCVIAAAAASTALQLASVRAGCDSLLVEGRFPLPLTLGTALHGEHGEAYRPSPTSSRRIQLMGRSTA